MITMDIRTSEHSTEEYSIFVSFPYDANIIDIIRTFPVKYWNAADKEWELPLSSLESLVDRLSHYEITVNANADVFNSNKSSTDIPDEFEYKTTPYEHQKVGLLYGLNHNKWVLGDEQGLGKTKEVIDIAVAKKIQKGYKHCLIICCVNGLKWNWQSEVKTHSDEKCWILGQRINKRGRLVVDYNDARLSQLVDLENNEGEISDCYFIITNVETLRSAEIANKLAELCKAGVINMIAADEVHKAKNATSLQGKGLLKLKTETMIAMSGTPLMNKPMDLYVPLKWISAETHSYYSFENHYAIKGGYGGYETIGYKNLDELQEKLDSVMLRRRKDEVLDLPEKTRIVEYVEMSTEQLKIYKEVKADIQSNIDQVKKASNGLSELIRLRQATGYTGILSSKIKESAKLDRMEELVEDSIANGKQIVIFSNWTDITDAVYDRLKDKYRVNQITGETKDADRDIIKNDYQDGKYDVLIGTTGAMGTGLTLTAGTVEIFMDEPWNRANKEQAEDRCHRIGQKYNLTIYTLVTKNSIDERIHEIVYEKGELADRIVDGKTEEMDRSSLIDYLLS